MHREKIWQMLVGDGNIEGGEGRNIKMRVAFPLSWSWLGMVVADTRSTMEMTRRPDDKPPTDF